MTRCDAAIRAGRSAKNSAISTGKFSRAQAAATRALVLAARLHGEADPLPLVGLQQRERLGHDIGHDARALRAAGHQQAQAPPTKSG